MDNRSNDKLMILSTWLTWPWKPGYQFILAFATSCPIWLFYLISVNTSIVKDINAPSVTSWEVLDECHQVHIHSSIFTVSSNSPTTISITELLILSDLSWKMVWIIPCTEMSIDMIVAKCSIPFKHPPAIASRTIISLFYDPLWKFLIWCEVTWLREYRSRVLYVDTL